MADVCDDIRHSDAGIDRLAQWTERRPLAGESREGQVDLVRSERMDAGTPRKDSRSAGGRRPRVSSRSVLQSTRSHSAERDRDQRGG